MQSVQFLMNFLEKKKEDQVSTNKQILNQVTSKYLDPIMWPKRPTVLFCYFNYSLQVFALMLYKKYNVCLLQFMKEKVI